MARIFRYQEQTWEDPGEGFSNEDVRKHLTQFFPELAQATIEEKTLDDGSTEVRFVKRAGTKGLDCEFRALRTYVGCCEGALYARADGMTLCAHHLRLFDAWIEARPGLTFSEWYVKLSPEDRVKAETVGQIRLGWKDTGVQPWALKAGDTLELFRHDGLLEITHWPTQTTLRLTRDERQSLAAALAFENDDDEG